MADAETPTLHDALMAVKPEGLSPNGWAVRAGVNRNVFNDVKRRGKLNSDILEKLLSAAEVSWAQFDAARAPRSTVPSEIAPATRDVGLGYRGDPLPPIPVLGSAIGCEDPTLGEMTEIYEDTILGWIARPPGLAGERAAYAATIVGDSMVPVLRPGATVTVSPRAPVRAGDMVVIQLRRADSDDDRVRMVLVKEFVRRTPRGILVKQYQPEELTFEIAAEQLVVAGGRAAVHRIVTIHL